MIKATDYIGSLILENDTLQFIQTAEGRVVKNVDGLEKNEYQYHLKDHLGNVRTTFAVRDDDYPTDFEFEIINDTTEHPYFPNYDEISILNNPLKRSGNRAHRLTGGGTDVVGLMKRLYVSKGDKISAEVYGKYLDAQFTDEGINGAALINALVGMLSGGTVTGEGSMVQNSLNTDFISTAMADDGQESSPKAYLNYILLDKNFNYLNSGFERLASSAADPGDGSGTHQRLSFEKILIEEDGYLMVFLSNESEQSVEVFWDDFKVDHHYNAVLQADDYYPFGLTFNSYQRSYSKGNNYKYNGKELQEETGWHDYGARMYMSDIGRWFNIDPLSEKYLSNSPYNYVANNPIYFIDPNGEEIWINYSYEEELEDGSLALRNGRVQYKGGVLYNENGEEYSGDNKFLNQVYSSLNGLSGSEKALSGIEELSDSDKKFIISETSGDNGANSTSEGGAYVKWNPNGATPIPTENGFNKDPAISLAHELIGHGLDIKRGDIKGDKAKTRGLKDDEWSASSTENIIRAELSKPLRTHYNVSRNTQTGEYGTLYPKLIKKDRKSGVIRDIYTSTILKKIED